MIVVGEQDLATPFASVSYRENAAYRIGAADRSPRPKTSWVRGVTLHTTQGKHPQPLREGLGHGGAALANVKYWNAATGYASAHLLVDPDGVVYQTADLVSEQTWHATTVNPVTVGVEVCQQGDGALYAGQVDVVVALCDWLTKTLGIQRQIPRAYDGKVVARLAKGARDFVGVFGHRDQTSNRGRGDPGDLVMERLAQAGYERFDLEAEADKAEWRRRQAAVGVTPDGVPGAATVAALAAHGHADGIYVTR